MPMGQATPSTKRSDMQKEKKLIYWLSEVPHTEEVAPPPPPNLSKRNYSILAPSETQSTGFSELG